MIEDFVPARSNLKTGFLIEPHYLERNKFARQVPTADDNITMNSGSYNTLQFQIDPETYVNPSGSVIGIYSGSTKQDLNINVSGYVLDEEQHGAQAPIEPTVTTGLYINDIQIEYREIRKRVS